MTQTMNYHLSLVITFVGIFSTINAAVTTGDRYQGGRNVFGRGETESSDVQKVNNENSQKCTDTFHDYRIIKPLGSGFTGDVLLVWHDRTQQFYAMKRIKRTRAAEGGEVDHVLNEKKILAASNYPFLVRLHCSFKDNSNVYLVMEFVCGGELFSHFGEIKTESDARFYAAQVVLALEHLHSKNITHRDLKFENILVDEQGYIKLADFGFAKQADDGRMHTSCGTPEYIAPEILQGGSYGKEVDMWAFGVLIYTMVRRQYPFNPWGNDKLKEVFRRIIYEEVDLPDTSFSAHLVDLLRNLLEKDPSKRYTASELKSHPWFSNYINWNQIANKRVIPPFKPKCKQYNPNESYKNADQLIGPISSKEEYPDLFEDFKK